VALLRISGATNTPPLKAVDVGDVLGAEVGFEIGDMVGHDIGAAAGLCQGAVQTIDKRTSPSSPCTRYLRRAKANVLRASRQV
jgi:hypothetical protein